MKYQGLPIFVMQEAGELVRRFKKKSAKCGLAPGTVVHVGEVINEKPVISVVDYSAEHFDDSLTEKIEDYAKFKDSESVTWINIDGLSDTKSIERIGRQFDLHPLVMEDIVNTSQRPKIENFDDHIYIVLKILRIDKKTNSIVNEQVSVIIGNGFVLSFQEQKNDVFDSIRKRLRSEKSRVRKCGADYLGYLLIDAIVDEYFQVIEKIAEVVEALDSEVLENPSPMTPRSIQGLRTELILTRRAVWPLRDSINSLQRIDSELISPQLLPYLHDLYDHTIQVVDATDSLRDLVSSLRDTYLTSIGSKTNEVMKVLTIIATIFIPLTFIAGVYGMNFENIPELKWADGYYYVLGLMGATALGMVAYFKNKGWL